MKWMSKVSLVTCKKKRTTCFMTKEMWNTKIHLGSKVIQIMAGKAEAESHYTVQGRQYYSKIFTMFELFKHIILFLDRWLCIYWNKVSWNQWKQHQVILQCNLIVIKKILTSTYGPQTRPEGTQRSGQVTNLTAYFEIAKMASKC